MLLLALLMALSFRGVITKTQNTFAKLLRQLVVVNQDFTPPQMIMRLNNEAFYALPPRSDYGANPQQRYAASECLLRSHLPVAGFKEELTCP